MSAAEARSPAPAPESEQTNLADKTVKGVGWTALALVGKQGIQFVVSILLARLLMPADFGLMGMIAVFTGFAALFSEMGLGAALVQRQEVNERHFSSVFWVNLLVGGGMAILFAAAAPWIAAFYSEEKLVSLVQLYAINFVIMPLSTVQMAILFRRMNFRVVAQVELMGALLAGLAAYALAMLGFGVWSLVWQSLVLYAATGLGFWFATQWRPRLLFDRQSIGELLGFSINLLGFNMVNYWIRNSDNLLIGRYLGTTALGIYSTAYMFLMLPLSQVTGVIGRVMRPALSRVQDDPARVKRIYLRTLGLVALVTFPMTLGLFVVAEPFVMVLLGPNWTGVIPLLRILSLLAMVQSLGTTVGWVFQSQGRTDIMFRWGVAAGVLTIGSIVLGIWVGTVEAVAISYAITSGLLLFYPSFAIPGKLIGMTVSDVVRSVSAVFACAAVMAALVWLLGLALPASWPYWAELVTQVSAGILVYGALLALAKIEAYENGKALLARLWRSKAEISGGRA